MARAAWAGAEARLILLRAPEKIADDALAERADVIGQACDVFGDKPVMRDATNRILEGGELRQVVVVLRDPVLDAASLSYTVQSLAGTMTDAGDEVSVFIDVIGMPRTPLSFAGAARRGYRRAWMR